MADSSQIIVDTEQHLNFKSQKKTVGISPMRYSGAIPAAGMNHQVTNIASAGTGCVSQAPRPGPCPKTLPPGS